MHFYPVWLTGWTVKEKEEKLLQFAHSFHSNEWTKLRDVRIVEDPDEWVGGYRPAVVYIYVSDPERCCIDFGDSEFEGMDLTYKLVDDKVRECICH